jgi:hypothetical protein
VPTLRDLQRRFAAALFDTASEQMSAEVRANGIDRLAIYRGQLHAVFARTLALEFPVIERLVGGAYFRQLALQFQAAHPSRAGNLHHIGAPFPAFLRDRFRGGDYDYLNDVAALEWALQESAVAADAPPLDPQVLRSIAPAGYAQLHFALHPAARLVSSTYPVLAIWHANQAGSAARGTIDLASGQTRVLVHRGAQGVGFHVLSAPECALLGAFAENSCLGTALEAALKEDAAFDLGSTLRRFVVLGAFTDAALSQLTGTAFDVI